LFTITHSSLRFMSKKMSHASTIINKANCLHYSAERGGRARRATGKETPLIVQDELDMFIATVEKSLPDVVTLEAEVFDWIGTQASIMGAAGDERFFKLAGRIVADQMWSEAPDTYLEAVTLMWDHTNPTTKKHTPIISSRVRDFVADNSGKLKWEEWFLDPHEYADRMQFIGMCTLCENYPLRTWDKHLLENINYMYLRIAIAVNAGKGTDDEIREHFELMSSGRVSHASPTMFYAGTPVEQYNSCFLLQIKEDSIEGIYEALKYVAVISRDAGGVGLTVSNIRAAGSPIRGLHPSDGIVPMLRQFNETAKYVDQGKTKRPGAFAVYLDVWHADLEDFLMLLQKGGDESRRTDKLHIALWSNDLFMRRVREKGKWSLMCPLQCPGLTEVHGKAFEELYCRYESEHKYVRQVDAEDVKLWIATSMCENGEPYMLQKDHACHGSNQQHLGTLKLSNLCVVGSTMLTTSKGPIQIGSFVPDSFQRTEMVKWYENTVDQVKTAESKVSEAGEFATAEEKQNVEHLRQLLSKLRSPEELKEHDDVEVWDGQEWVTVEPRLIGEDTPVMTIGTDFGALLNVSHNHTFILEDGVTRVKARDLRLGQRLVQTPPVLFSGTDVDTTQRLTCPGAYLTGVLTAYALKTYGKKLSNNVGATYKVELIKIAKKGMEDTKLPQLLEYVGYDQAKAEEQYPDIDHDEIAVVNIPRNMHSIGVPVLAVTEERRAWVQGFVELLGGAMAQASGPLERMQGVMRMFCSVGEDVRLVIDPADNSWSLRKRHPDETPAVMTMIDAGRLEKTYCFTNKRHAAVFGGQLTGQCTEILEFVSPDEIACCTLCSFALTAYWNVERAEFEWDMFEQDVIKQVKFMNRVIDTSFYALEEMRRSNMRHRPLAIGVQGLATLFAMAGMSWEETTPDGRVVPNRRTRVFHSRIFELLYQAALIGSHKVAKARCAPYGTFAGSPVSQGKLRFDLFPKHDDDVPLFYKNWDLLKHRIATQGGLANSLLVGPMPTATTAKILNNSEGVDPLLANCFVQSGLAGHFLWTNPHLVKDCKNRGLWNEKLRDAIELSQGSVQGLVPADMENIYKTHSEISKKVLIRFQADRQRFIDQGQSVNMRYASPNVESVWRSLDYSWELGNPNGVYYTRSNASMDPQNMTAAVHCTREGGGCCDA
jgi:ribonucleotide reductase alpha subunit